MVIPKFIKIGGSTARRNDDANDAGTDYHEAVYSPFGRRKLDYSLYERQVRARIVTALNRSRLLAAQVVLSD